MTTRAGGRRRRAERRPRRRAALPGAERLLGQRAQLGHRDVAGHDQRGVVRHEVLLPERHACRRASSPSPTPRCRSRCSRTGCCVPYSAAAVTCAATAAGLSRCCTSCPSRCARCRSISSAGNDGRSATSAIRSSVAGKFFGERPRRHRRRVHRAAGRRATRRAARPRRQSAARCASPCPRRASRPRSWRARACRAGWRRCRVLNTRLAATIGTLVPLAEDQRQAVRQRGRWSASAAAAAAPAPASGISLRHGSSALIDSVAGLCPAAAGGAGGVGAGAAAPPACPARRARRTRALGASWSRANACTLAGVTARYRWMSFCR